MGNIRTVTKSEEYGKWIKEPRTADCPVCGSDSMPVRQSPDKSSEFRRCAEKHEFETTVTYVTCPPSEATRQLP
jgi:hypothetical protein